MIRNPNDIQEGAKKIRMLIAGYPGIGKSTLALSAPNPLHIDVDFGIDRIEPRYRKPYIQPKSYDEILGDLTPMNLQDFDTLVFDTGGKLISLMSLWAIKKDPKYDPYWQRFMCMNWDDVGGCSAGCTDCDSCTEFRRIRPQYCARCGGTFYERKENRFCAPCRTARKKQAQRHWCRVNGYSK